MSATWDGVLHPRRSIAARVMLLVAICTLTTLVVLGAASWSELRSADIEISRAHELVVANVARQIDDYLADALSTLQQFANDARAFEPMDEHEAGLRNWLVAARPAAARLDAIFIAALDGRVWARAPEEPRLETALVTESVSRMQRTPGPVVATVSAPGRRVIVLVVPLRNWQGDLLGVVTGVLDPNGPRFAQAVLPLAIPLFGQMDLTDGDGVLMASHAATEPRGAHGGPVVATATLTLAPWRIASHRAEGTVALVDRYGAVLPWLGPLLVGGLLFLAWGAGWSVRRPLLALTRAAERLAAGDLSTPVSSTGRDEIGQLGRAFESMRRALETSHGEIEAARSVLEQRVQERTRELERVNRELRDREEVRQLLLRRVITAQEDERKRIARELHDEACQTVAALGLRLDAALATPSDDDDAHEALARARELATRSLDELHRLMHALRPALLDDLGLVAAIRQSTERLGRLGMSVRFESNISSIHLPMEVETAVFRAVQEALTNVERHARADMALVQVSAEDGTLTIDVEDDGSGFDPGAVAVTTADGRGLGLLGIRERLQLAGGVADIQSSPGKGTYVSIRVPVPEGAIHVEDQGAHRG
jgi:signal transduction histidine kinase